MDDRYIGWLAGIIDGEGCFTLRILYHQTKTLGKRARYQPQLVICNTVESMIDRICVLYDEIGIKYRKYLIRRSSKNPRWKDIYHVIVLAPGLRILLPLVSDLLIKKKEADIFMEFMSQSKARGCQNPYTSAEIQGFEVLRQRLIALHGNQAQKLSKPISGVKHVSDAEMKEYKEDIGNRTSEGRRKN